MQPMKIKLFALTIFLCSQFSFAAERIEGVWGNPGGSFSFFSDGSCTISWATQGKFTECAWKMDGMDLEVMPKDSASMAFMVIFDGEYLVLSDQDGQYQYKRNRSDSK